MRSSLSKGKCLPSACLAIEVHVVWAALSCFQHVVQAVVRLMAIWCWSAGKSLCIVSPLPRLLAYKILTLQVADRCTSTTHCSRASLQGHAIWVAQSTAVARQKGSFGEAALPPHRCPGLVLTSAHDLLCRVTLQHPSPSL